ncbi:MAG: 2-amino-4-hydroxy-6-hydroxymethyldihydropteridine diphosphokinase [Dehalococcoidales bacterium]|nr:2-amino-4-hydroxy-6-hydroxymethyldihydropteridine diphosphokinase [Dehalococcoidales bacterium]
MSNNMFTVYLGLGSNMGNRTENLKKALGYIEQRMRVVTKSSVYETDPIGNTSQPKFLNMVCEVKTSLPPESLLVLAKGIEKKLGRMPNHPKDSPRTMDIDILFYGDQVLNNPDLIIPHPRLSKSAFVLMPMNEIAPSFIDPSTGKTIADLYREIQTTKQGVLKLGGC